MSSENPFKMQFFHKNSRSSRDFGGHHTYFFGRIQNFVGWGLPHRFYWPKFSVPMFVTFSKSITWPLNPSFTYVTTVKK